MTNALLTSLRQNLRQAILQRRLPEAEQVLARLKREDPLSVETRGSELELAIESGRLAEADDLARQLCDAFPTSARVFYLAGKLAYRRKRYDGAASLFRESRRLHANPPTQYWLGKTLTQAGKFEEAEALLLEIRDVNPWALLVLGWLYERKNELEAALAAYDGFLQIRPADPFAAEQKVRVKAKMLDPETLIDEVQALADFGEPVPDALFSEYIQGLLETGQTPRARDEITARLGSMEAREGVRIAWICYRHHAFDLACTLFLTHLRANLFDFKYLAALEAAARKCNRLPHVLGAYHPLCPEAPHLYGRRKLLMRKT